MEQAKSAPNYDSASQFFCNREAATVEPFSYVYILQSDLRAERFYVGLTDDLNDRLRRHNAGEMPHTAKYIPWHIKTAVAFRDRMRAVDFERYLKTASGRAFAKKRL